MSLQLKMALISIKSSQTQVIDWFFQNHMISLRLHSKLCLVYRNLWAQRCMWCGRQSWPREDNSELHCQCLPAWIGSSCCRILLVFLICPAGAFHWTRCLGIHLWQSCWRIHSDTPWHEGAYLYSIALITQANCSFCRLDKILRHSFWYSCY